MSSICTKNKNINISLDMIEADEVGPPATCPWG